MRTSGEINAEIYNFGAALFDAVRQEVTDSATVAESPREHGANRQRLAERVQEVLDHASLGADIGHEGLWQILWRRVVYAGTRSAKATAEISSMSLLVPLFQSLDHFAEGRYVFDRAEWERFNRHWRGRYSDSQWLRRAKADPEWNPDGFFKKMTPEVWKVLIKDEASYPGLRMSVLPQKIEKYFKIAHLLHRRRIAESDDALHHYMGGHSFSQRHLTGEEWSTERQLLVQVRERFAEDVGRLTAMHVLIVDSFPKLGHFGTHSR